MEQSPLHIDESPAMRINVNGTDHDLPDVDPANGDSRDRIAVIDVKFRSLRCVVARIFRQAWSL